MKIIFICTKSITFNTFLKSQANFFLKKKYEVEVACSDIENLNFKCNFKHKIEFPTKILDLFNLFKFVRILIQIKKITNKNSSTLFFIHTPVAAYLFRFFTFFEKIKIIYFVHGFRFTSTTNIFKKFILKIIEKILSKKTDLFITINNEDYNYTLKNLTKRTSCYKVNGVGLNPTSKYHRKKIKKKNFIKNILIISAYKKEKGYHEILKVAEILKGKKIKLDCYGYGNYNKFNSIKFKKKLHNISFKKFDINLEKKIKKYDILLHLSKREGLPVSVMQCLSHGLPVICYDIRGNNDLIIDKFNGLFVKTYKEVPLKILYLNLEKQFFYDMSYNAIKSINKHFFRDQINLNLYNIITNFKFQK